MIIEFISNKPGYNAIVVSSKSNKNIDIFISDFVSIILASKNIKNIVKYKRHNDDNIVFDLELLDKHFVNAFINRIIQGLYSFDKYISKNSKNSKVLFFAPQLTVQHKNDINILCQNACLTRNMINEPSNKSTPSMMSSNVSKMFKNNKNITVKILSDKDIKKRGLGLIDAIGNSSANNARFIIIDYHPKNSKKTICLVGKGVTIDTGGYSIKSSHSMYNMHMDKTGASVCIGLLKALSQVNYKNRIIVLCPLVENVISNNSVKPNDIIKAYNGQTVEIVNVDAEGRLILADALSYACKNYNPDYIFDFATLTGWSERIHCHTSFTYFTLSNKLSNTIVTIGDKYAERSIRMPPWTDYLYFIKSNIADVKNYNFDCQNSDGIMASIFLMNFIPQQYRKKWVHFDIRLNSYNNNVNIADGFASYYNMLLQL